jgi:hypothetical protein
MFLYRKGVEHLGHLNTQKNNESRFACRKRAEFRFAFKIKYPRRTRKE